MENFKLFYGAPKLCAAYIIFHTKSSIAYVGSTDDIYVRKINHERELRLNKHHNRLLQSAYNEDSNVRFLVHITETREEAYDAEQDILDRYFNTGVLFNFACNARVFGKGLKKSIQHREKIRQSTLGKNKGKIWSDEQHIKQSIAHKGKKASLETIEKMQISKIGISKPVSANGNVYRSIKAAARANGISKSTVRQRCDSKSDRYLTWFFIN